MILRGATRIRLANDIETQAATRAIAQTVKRDKTRFMSKGQKPLLLDMRTGYDYEDAKDDMFSIIVSYNLFKKPRFIKK